MTWHASRTVGKRNEFPLPPGFEFVEFDRTRLILPEAVALEKIAAMAKHHRALLDEQDQREEERKAEAKAEAAQAALEAMRKGAEVLKPARRKPVAGHYRIIPKWAEFVKAPDDEGAALRSADADVNKRVAKLREKLIEKGPDRRIAHPKDWRNALDRLEASLPHFREPVKLLRNTLALAEVTKRPVRVPPMLLLGPPGVGKTHFSQRVAELMGAPHASLAFDQPSAGSNLRGSDAFWSNSSTGLLFNLICLGDHANPVILLDELDKSSFGTGRHDVDPLAQLHGALEPETSRYTVDSSVEIEFDASQVTYIATANTLRGLTLPILSRMEVFTIEPPDTAESVEIARAIVDKVLERTNLRSSLGFDRKGFYVLAHLSPRLMLRTTEKAVAAAVAAGRTGVSEADLWAELGPDDEGPRPH